MLSFYHLRAAKYLVRTGPVVTLEVAKQAALYHGLATMLNQPSPELSRGKGDGADLSFEEDDEFSGDDMDFLGVGGASGYDGSRYNMYHYNGDMRSSCSSSTLVASDSMHLLSPPRPPEDYLRRPTAFPHHLQLQLQTFHQRQQKNDMEMDDQSSSSYACGDTAAIVSGGASKNPNKKLIRQLSFPQEEEEEELDTSVTEDTTTTHNLLKSSTTAELMTSSSKAAENSEATLYRSSSLTSAEASNDITNSCQPTGESTGLPCTVTSLDECDDIVEEGNDILFEEHDLANDKHNSEDDEMTKKKAALVNEINRYCLMRKKATSFPQCSLFSGVALAHPTTTTSCTNLDAMDNSKYRRQIMPKNSDKYKDKRSTMRATVSASVLLTSSVSLNDVSLSSVPSSSSTKHCESSKGNSAFRDSNYWSSNCSTRNSSTLCSPSSTLSSTNAALMRASQSDSSLARWNDSFEALSRKGLSESALGVPRVVGSSRLLKFLISTYNNGNSSTGGGNSQENGGGYTNTDGYYGARKPSNTFTFLPTRSKSSDAILTCEYPKNS